MIQPITEEILFKVPQKGRWKGKSLCDRFFEKIILKDTCWNWAGTTRCGMGVIRILNKNYPTSHIMLFLEGLDVPSGMKVFHKCKNGLCINPRHLELGTSFGRSVNNKIRKKLALSTRFWDNVEVKQSDECWIWKASCDKRGYGQFNIAKKMKRSHRIAWKLTFGEIPKELYVCHKCDNPPCCNPNHLFLGTQKDNIADMLRKGRGKKYK